MISRELCIRRWRAVNNFTRATPLNTVSENLLSVRRRGWQQDLKARATLGPVPGRDLAVHLLDDAPADAQAEAGALAARLGGDEGHEQARQHLGRDARS